MLTSRERYRQVRVGHELLIRQSECQVMASTYWIRPVNPTDEPSCWLIVCWPLGLDGCALCYGIYTSPQPGCG